MSPILEVRCIPVSVPRRRPLQSALGRSERADVGIVIVRTADGLQGVGEIDLIWHGGALSLWRDVNDRIGPGLVGEDATNVATIHQRLSTLMTFGRHTLAVRAAIDMACYDILGQRAGLPLHELLGGKIREDIPLSMSVHMGTEMEMVTEAVQYVTQGFRTVKVKVGRDPAVDLAAVAGIRRAVGDQINLRVDANMAWKTPKEALAIIDRLSEFRVISVEQPLTPQNMTGLAFLTTHSRVPIMVDESVWSPEDAWHVIRAGAADLLNIYVTESGGIRPMTQIFGMCEVAHMSCAIGSMPEFGWATAAQAHVGVTAVALDHPSDVAGVLYQEDDLIEDPLEIRHGVIIPPSGPGLGVRPDWNKINFYRLDR